MARPQGTELYPERARLGEWLRARRREAELSQSDVARAAGLPDDGTVARIERGELAASETVLRALARALRRPWSELVSASAPRDEGAERNPYRGLAAFRASDAARYFGRTAVVQLLVRKLAYTPVVALVGASGSGKSSLVAAGVLPALDASGGLLAVEMRPGSRPFDALAVALHPHGAEGDSISGDRSALQELAHRLKTGAAFLEFQSILQRIRGEARLLLIVDQFEELFTQCREPEVRRRFVDVLLELARSHGVAPDGPRILLVLRGDFFGHILADRALADALQDHVVHLPPMSPSELEEAIRRPATFANCTFEDGLVERILEDAGDEPGRMPLVQYCLSLLWADRSGDTFTLAAYDALGGLDGAIAGQAERVFIGFGDGGQRAVRRLMTRLVRVAEPGEGAETRRRLPLSVIASTQTDREVVEALVAARLLTTDFDDSLQAETVELAHEAVIQHWARLHDWLTEDRQFLLWQQRLERTVREWKASGEDEGTVLRGKLLTDGEAWAELRPEDLSADVAAFLAASVRVRNLEAGARALEQARFLLSAQPNEVLRIVDSLGVQLASMRERLEEMLVEADASRKWRLQLALLDAEPAQADALCDHLLVCAPDELPVLVAGLERYRETLGERLWGSATAEQASGRRLRAACALGVWAPDAPGWQVIARDVAAILAGENPLHLLTWIEPLRAVRSHLIPHLRRLMINREAPPGIRDSCALVLLQFTRDDPVTLASVAAETSIESFPILYGALSEQRSHLGDIERELAATVTAPYALEDDEDEHEQLAAGSRKAVAAIILTRLDRSSSIMSLFDEAPDPEAATQFVHQCKLRGVNPGFLATELLAADTAMKRYWLTMALGEFAMEEIRADLGTQVVDALQAWYRADPSAAVHAGAGWLLASWGRLDIVEQVDRETIELAEIEGREWFTLDGPTAPVPFVRIPGGTYTMGCTLSEAGAKGYETPPHEAMLTHPFALAAREVTRAEYERFVMETERESLPDIDEWSPTGMHPVVGLTWFEAEAYVAWLGEALRAHAPGSSTVLRLPTEAEWERACRAGTTTAFSFGSDRALLRRYGWYQDNSGLQTHPFRILRPNRYGLFNMHGNCWEWCSDWYGGYPAEAVTDPQGREETDWHILRGGCWNLNERYSRSACRNWHIPTNRNWYIGLRVALTFDLDAGLAT